MKLTLMLLCVLIVTGCDKTIHEARLRVDQANLSSVSQSGLTYSAPNN